MRVSVLLFGVLRELVGSPVVVCEMAEGATAGDVIARVRQDAGSADGGVWGALAVAVNEVYASREQVVEPGDVVALLPPVSGGAVRAPAADLRALVLPCSGRQAPLWCRYVDPQQR